MGPIKSKNELDEPIEAAVITDIKQLPLDLLDDLNLIGKVLYCINIDNTIVIEAYYTLNPLSEGSLLCNHHGHVLGRIHEVFGPITNPFYTVRWKDDVTKTEGKSILHDKTTKQSKKKNNKGKSNEKRSKENKRDDSMKVKDDSMEVKDDSMEVKDDSMKVKDDSMEVKDDSMKVKDDSMEVKDDSMEMKNDSMKVKDDSMEVKDDSLEMKDGSMDMKDDSMKVKDDSMEVKDGSMEMKDDSLELKVDSLEMKVDSMEMKVDSLELKVDIMEEEVDIMAEEIDIFEGEDDNTDRNCNSQYRTNKDIIIISSECTNEMTNILQVFSIGVEVYTLKDHCSFVMPNQIRTMFGKGSDASNYYDEEVRPQAYHDIIIMLFLLILSFSLSICIHIHH